MHPGPAHIGAMSGPEALVDLTTFLGDWRDSMGNNVRVEWARPGSRGGQLNVELSKPRSSRDPIRLDVKSMGRGRFTCGHYDMDVDRSYSERIVWIDCRNRGKVSVWERQEPSPSRSSWQPWTRSSTSRGSQDHVGSQDGRDSCDDRNNRSGPASQDGKDGCDDRALQDGHDLRDSHELQGSHDVREVRVPQDTREGPSRYHLEDWSGSQFGWDASNQSRPTWHGMHFIQPAGNWDGRSSIAPGAVTWHPPLTPGAWLPHTISSVTPGAWVPPFSVANPIRNLTNCESSLAGAYETREHPLDDLHAPHMHKRVSIKSEASCPPGLTTCLDVEAKHQSVAVAGRGQGDISPGAWVPPASVSELAEYDKSLLRAAGSHDSSVDASAEDRPQETEAETSAHLRNLSSGAVESAREDPPESSPAGLASHGGAPDEDHSSAALSLSAPDARSGAAGAPPAVLPGPSLDKPLDTLTDDSSEASLDDVLQVEPDVPGEPAQALPGCSPEGEPVEVPMQDQAEAMRPTPGQAAVPVTGGLLRCIPLSHDPPQDPRRNASQSSTSRAISDGPQDPRTRPNGREPEAPLPSGLSLAAPSSVPEPATGASSAGGLGGDPLHLRSASECSLTLTVSAMGLSPTEAASLKLSSALPAAHLTRPPEALAAMTPAVSPAVHPVIHSAASLPIVEVSVAKTHASNPSVTSPAGSGQVGTVLADASPPAASSGAHLASTLAAQPTPPWASKVGSTPIQPALAVPPTAEGTPQLRPPAIPSPPPWTISGSLLAGQHTAQACALSPLEAHDLTQQIQSKAHSVEALLHEHMAPSESPQNFPHGSRAKAAPPPNVIPVQPPVEPPSVSLVVPQAFGQMPMQQGAPWRAVEAARQEPMTIVNQDAGREQEDSQRRLAAYSALLLGGGGLGGIEQQAEEEEAPWRLRKRRRTGGTLAAVTTAGAMAPLAASSVP